MPPEITEISKIKKIVFYPLLGLNQSYFDLLGQSSWSIDANLHCQFCKTLAHYFDMIVIPPGSFLFQFNKRQMNEINRFLNERAISDLIHAGVIVSAAAPNFEKTDFINEYRQKFFDIDWPNISENNSSQKQETWKNIDVISRNFSSHSGSISQSIADQFNDEFLGLRRLNDSIDNVYKRSKDPDFGNFDNERFMLNLIDSDLDFQVQSRLVFFSSRAHLYANATEMPGVFNFVNVADERFVADFPHLAIYHPYFFERFLTALIGSSCVRRIANMNAQDLLQWRSTQEWRDFVIEYHKILSQIAIIVHDIKHFTQQFSDPLVDTFDIHSNSLIKSKQNERLIRAINEIIWWLLNKISSGYAGILLKILGISVEKLARRSMIYISGAKFLQSLIRLESIARC